MMRLIRWCTIFSTLLFIPTLALAQGTYPDRPVRFVIAFPPGGATDTFFRLISNELGTALGQSVVIENKGGAGGYIAWQMVAASPADGYTVLVAENAIGINQALFKKHPSGFNPLKDYDAVGAMASVPVVWTVANNVPANTFPEFVNWSKTVPGHFNYGHAGPGSVSHLIPEVILDGAGMQAVPVPFKGGGPAAQAVAGGFVSVVVSSLAVAKPQMEGKLLKGLLVTSAKRSPAIPDVPTLKELGVKVADVDLEFWWGLFVPKGTPEPIRAKIEKALQATMQNPAVRERLAKVDTDPSFAPGPALRVKLEREITNWSKFIDAKGIKVEQYLLGNGADVSEEYGFVVNGHSVSVSLDGTTPLLTVLRDELALCGAKFGCGTEQCGACMILIDGVPMHSCAREVSTVAGKTVTTVEGLARNGGLHPLQQALLDEEAGQCGYCLPGIVVSAAALLEKNKKPSRADIVAALDPHLCRCGIHNRVIRAVQKAAGSPP